MDVIEITLQSYDLAKTKPNKIRFFLFVETAEESKENH